MLLLGIILITSYLTKAYDRPPIVNKNNEYEEKIPTIDEVYAMRPSQIYDAMFTKPSLWQGYETINVKKVDKV
jgi:hypothetical protein